MTCFETFISENYDDLLAHSIRCTGKKYGADMLHDMIESFLQKQDTLEAMCYRGEMMSYMCRAIYISSFSKNSAFYKKYKQHDQKQSQMNIEWLMQEVDDDIIHRQEEQLKKVYAILQEIQWFDREVFKAYYLHNHTLDTFTHATGIPRQTLYRSIRKAKNKIKEKIEEFERSGG